jgi:hypothetical protein
MQSRAARLILLGLFLTAIITATFLFWKGDTEASGATLQAKAFDASARALERGVLDLRAAQLGYAAASQPGERWVSRVSQHLEAAQTGLQALRAEATVPEAQAGFDAAMAALNEFAKSDRRAAEYVRNDQRTLASDVVFGDGLERTDAALVSLEQARLAEVQVREAAVGVFRKRQAFALATGAAASVLAVLLLVPVAKPAPTVAPAPVVRIAESRRPEPAARAVELDEGIVRPPRRVSELEPTLASLAPAEAPAAAAEPVAQTEGVDIPEPAPAHATDFAGVASLCVDLARVVDTRALPSLLDRTASLLDASGIILWIADPDGRELNPIFAQGYPQQLVNRLGTIPRDAENATAAAFRTSLLQTVMADEISGGAIAAPLVTSGGCVGVMAAEVRHDSERQDGTLAAATIVAAQLATLVGPPSARPQTRSASGA